MENTKMTVTLIDIANLKVEFFADRAFAKAKAEKEDLLYVAGIEDLGDVDLTGPQIVALYNATALELDTGLSPVARFATKEAGVKRLWANIQDLMNATTVSQEMMAENPAPPKSLIKLIETKSRDRAAPAKFTDTPPVASRRGTGINLAPLSKIYPCRQGSKQALLVDMLNRPQGATMAELLSAMSGGSKPWKEVTVKSGLNWDMNKIKGYGIRTTKRGTEDCYHLVLPAGVLSPAPHITKKGA
jgi:hypothetical protein